MFAPLGAGYVIGSGFVSGFIFSGGDVETAMVAVITAGMSKYLNSSIFMQGTIGGISSSLKGGKFVEGFVSAAAGEFVSPGVNQLPNIFVRTIVTAVVGGTAAEIGGGKFENGAVTAAFSYLFVQISQNSIVDRAMKKIEFYDSYDVDLGGFSEYKGSISGVRDALTIYAETPKGQEALNNLIQSDDSLIIVSESGEPFVDNHRLVLHWDGLARNPPREHYPAALVLAHEMGHTVFGGAYDDYPGQFASTGTLGNVHFNENAMRAHLGMTLNNNYRRDNSCWNAMGVSKVCP